ncbi:MAG: ISL3 family transposase, partial [Olsenella sp.]
LAVATDRVRCRERGESAEKRALLRGTKYVWLRREGTLSDRQLGVSRDPAREHLMTARACAMTEAVRGAYECPTRDEAAAELDRALSWMMHSNVPEMRVAARSIRAEREGVPDYFSARATNAFLEGVNSVIQSVRRAARGSGNVEYLKTEIFLRLGRLDFPTSPQMAALGATH